MVAVNSVDLLYRVLSPANQNTFRYILEKDYTSMFEMPYGRATVQGGGLGRAYALRSLALPQEILVKKTPPQDHEAAFFLSMNALNQALTSSFTDVATL